MFKKIERQLRLFTEGTGLADRCEIVHGTLYVKLKDDKNCDFFHTELRGLLNGVHIQLISIHQVSHSRLHIKVIR